MDFDILNDFVLDSRELLDEVEPELIELFRLYADGNNSADHETINQIFRLFHSLKGSAGFLQLEHLVAVAHHAETMLDYFRAGKAQIEQKHIDMLCSACDLVRKMLDGIAETGSDENFQVEANAMIKKLEDANAEISKPTFIVNSKIQKKNIQKEEIEEVVQKEEIKEDNSSKNTQFSGGIIITPEMIRSFIQESDDQLKLIEACILILVQLQDEESLQEAFRCFHSIKGNAGFLGYRDIEKLAHRAEDALETVASQKDTLSESSCQILLRVVDTLRVAINLIEKNEVPSIGNLDELVKDIESIHKGNGDKANLETPKAKPEVVLKTKKETTTNRLQKPAESPQKPIIENIKSLAEDKPDSSPRPTSLRSSSLNRKDIRVDLEKLDQLINLVGELVIAESMVVNNPDLVGHDFENFEKASRHLQKISRDLQDIALAIRMVPLASTFKKMVRLVHDLAVKTNKKIDLIIKGEDTEIDKTLVESISDPLVHLIRNSADHGIETPEQRLKVGKPETGTIHLEALHEEGEVNIIISDDGKGLDAEKIFKKALERGIIAENHELTEKEILKLIFEPGFSTADEVSDISGRGVGLDVLKKNLEKLKGHIDIRNRPGQGCRFIMRIPLTLAIIEGMLVQVGSRHYTIPLLSIRESLKAKSEHLTYTMDGRELFSLREELIPIMRLYELHNIQDSIQKIEEGIIVILESPHGNFGLLVDKVLGQQQTVIKPLSGFLGNLRGVSGCTIMGNGEISLILDISSLLDFQIQEETA